MAILNKVIIVEGKSDKKKVQQVIAEPVNIICTWYNEYRQTRRYDRNIIWKTSLYSCRFR